MPIPLAYFAIVGIVGYLFINGKSNKVFISYYSKGDSHYKNMIMAWVNNNNFELDFDDVSTDVKIKSTDTKYMKRRIKEQIKKADFFIVFVGEDTHEREWVSWEIKQAQSMCKPIIAVKEKV
ncbi:MAG: TIR domain-containing protein [Alphaproteobacteria bacterium]|nr:TIR domain-containing protein [Alphaproteobacteria bacterium]